MLIEVIVSKYFNPQCFIAMQVYGCNMSAVLSNSFPTLNHNSFQSIEEYSNSLQGLQLDGCQLSRGDFNGNSSVLTANGFQLGVRESEAKHFQNATVEDKKIGMIFPLIQEEHINNGEIVGPEKQYIILHGDENRLILPNNNKHTSLLFSTDQLDNYFSEDEVEHFMHACQGISTSMVSSDKKLLITQKLYNLFEDFKVLDKRVDKSPLAYEDAYEALFYALNNYLDAHTTKIFNRVKNNERLLARALEYIHSEPLQALTVSSLVKNIHASSRSIQYCFSELLGMSPKKYLVRLRLNAIRRELNDSSPTEKTITNIANNYGVINIGRFKQDYEEFFNETPRETLFNS